MRAFLLYLLLALFAIALQGTLLSGGTKPDFVLIFVIFYALKQGQLRGVVYGALTGLLIDSANGLILGPNILSKALIGYSVPFFRKKLFEWNSIVSAFFILVFSLFDLFLNYLCFTTFRGMPILSGAVKIAVLHIIATTVAGLFLYFPLHPERGQRASYLK